LRQLQRLDLWGAPISGPGLAALAETPHLHGLTLSASHISDAALEHLRHVPELEELELDRTSITDRGLAHLAPLKALRTLSLEQCEQLTGTGLTSLGLDAPLTNLRLTGCSIVGDAAMEHAGQFRNLTRLWLSDTAVGDGGLVALSDLEHLENLQLGNCTNVTDEGLLHLTQLKRLQYLNVHGCPTVSDEGVARLQASLPNCRIRR
jgi:hypothetical protein